MFLDQLDRSMSNYENYKISTYVGTYGTSAGYGTIFMKWSDTLYGGFHVGYNFYGLVYFARTNNGRYIQLIDV